MNMVVLPMFAGGDFGALNDAGSRSHAFVKQLPLKLLAMDEVVKFVASNEPFVEFLEWPLICRHLIYLGGVPRPIVDFLSQVKSSWTPEQTKAERLEIIEKSFRSIWSGVEESLEKCLAIRDQIQLAARAISGWRVKKQWEFLKDMSWADVRDSSACLLYPSFADYGYGITYEVHIPYTMLRHIAQCYTSATTEAEKAFAFALQDLMNHVDERIFDGNP